MEAHQLREKFIEFFSTAKAKHAVVPSSSLIPDDPSVLLTTAGMQQFKPYFVGKADPMRDFGAKNAVSIQKSFRTSDIDEVGDDTHLTFFEMLGNFSFGGYFKEEAIKLACEFLKKIGLKIEYVTVFGGDDLTPEDKESAVIWQALGVKDIRKAGREDNFWGPTGNEGPCGPTTEIYINGTEIWNIVFNEYYCRNDGTFEKLEVPGVDTGMGLERLAAVSQGKGNIFETDLFQPLIALLPDAMSERTKRIMADHARAVVFLLADGVRPSNKEAGYVLRRLMRRMIVHEYLNSARSFSGDDKLGMGGGWDITGILKKVIENYHAFYKELDAKIILEEFQKENEKFQRTLKNGLKELEHVPTLNAESAFRLYESFGLPYEALKEVGAAKAENLTREDFDVEFKKHQELSRAGRERKFGGHGLILDTGEIKAKDEAELKKVTRLHTATHLLQAALRDILGENVHQDGSDITAERLRFDFIFNRRLTDEEIKKVEDWVRNVVALDVPVVKREMLFEDAVKTGAIYFKKEKYPKSVKVYSAEDPKTGKVYSRELCGGPHVSRTGEVGKFKIQKQESVSAGVRRIRATVE